MVDLDELARLLEKTTPMLPFVDMREQRHRFNDALVAAAPALLTELRAARECVAVLREDYSDDPEAGCTWNEGTKALAAYDAATQPAKEAK